MVTVERRRRLQAAVPAELFAEIDRIKNTQDSAGTDHNLWDEFLSPVKGNIDVALSSLRDALKPTRATPTKDLDAVSIAAGGTEEITKSGLNGYSALIVIVRATYDASASAGVRVRWLYSPDGTNYDSPEDAEDQGNYEDLTFSAGATRQRTVLIPILTDPIRIQIVNKDTSYSVVVDAWSVKLR